jgi:hypothetical protein
MTEDSPAVWDGVRREALNEARKYVDRVRMWIRVVTPQKGDALRADPMLRADVQELTLSMVREALP